MTSEANNVIDFTAYRQAKELKSVEESERWQGVSIYDFDNWSVLHKEQIEQKIQMLVDEGIITAGNVHIDEYGIPYIYVTPNNMFYDVTINPEASNT